MWFKEGHLACKTASQIPSVHFMGLSLTCSNYRLVGWSLMSLFSTNTAISETTAITENLANTKKLKALAADFHDFKENNAF